MTVDETNPTLPEADEWPEPTPEQLDLIRRVFAPHVRRALADEHAEQQSAA